MLLPYTFPPFSCPSGEQAALHFQKPAPRNMMRTYPVFREVGENAVQNKKQKNVIRTALSGEKAIRRAMVADGRVQGVGFRYFARSLAREHGVTGWVMNMPDGTVAMEVQGPEDRVDSFAGAISNPPTDWYIRVTSLKIRNIPLVPDESGFAIRFYGQRF